MGFCKRCHGERQVGLNERARRGGEDGMLGGGYGGAGGGGDGGEVLVEKMGSFDVSWWKGVEEGSVLVIVVVGMVK